MVSITHRDQEGAVINAEEAVIIVRSRRDPSQRYTVRAIRSLDTGVLEPYGCSCPNGKHRRRARCYHLQVASELLETRGKMATQRAVELVEGAKLAGWSRDEYLTELERQRHLHSGDRYAAVLGVERLLRDRYGIIREDE